MARKEVLKPYVRSWEDGYVNHPNDKGGPTKWGVTIGTYRSVYGQGKSVADLKAMTEAQWDYICGRLFWDRWKADEIKSQSVANLLVDWVWGSGVYGIKYAQEVLGVVADGIVGPKTLAAVNAADESTLFAKLWKRRKEHFEDCARKPGQAVFLKGWLNRLSGIKYGKLACNTYMTSRGIRYQKVVTWKSDKAVEQWVIL